MKHNHKGRPCWKIVWKNQYETKYRCRREGCQKEKNVLVSGVKEKRFRKTMDIYENSIKRMYSEKYS